MQGELGTCPLGAEGECCCTGSGVGEGQSHRVMPWWYFCDGLGSWRLSGREAGQKARHTPCSRQGAAGLHLCTAGCCRNCWNKMMGSEASTRGEKWSTRQPLVSTSSSPDTPGFPTASFLPGVPLAKPGHVSPRQKWKVDKSFDQRPISRPFHECYLLLSAWDSGTKPNGSYPIHNNI